MDTWNAQEYYLVYLTLVVFEEQRPKPLLTSKFLHVKLFSSSLGVPSLYHALLAQLLWMSCLCFLVNGLPMGKKKHTYRGSRYPRF